VLSAALFLGEPLHAATIVSMVMILLGVTARFLFPVRQPG